MTDEVPHHDPARTAEPDVLIRRGIPSMPSMPRDTLPAMYPYEAIHVAKLLREHGLVVDFEDDRADREYYTHDAFDIWLPVMNLAVGVVGGVTVALINDVIKKLTKRGDDDADRPNTVLHVEITVTDPDGHQKHLKIDGSPDDVFTALDRLNPDEEGHDGPHHLPGA
ncbi:hypothetical protein DL991_10080 [Amycolatopsis sp. WAC 01375]|uniref:hypothetical protein n=1 Tax=Amycolatopsis sp. WAC 01375 TaxID=2203194 RepID=UPI000F770171|nr:hypothetical protein [Amycolatopsis sp. WAC 01375]RSM80469.1 hypothetical protein DL991_10080 [Amycolatopsis sp. WAC 01375]